MHKRPKGARPARVTDCDLVANNGRVIDPERMCGEVANPGVGDGRISVMTKDKITGCGFTEIRYWPAARNMTASNPTRKDKGDDRSEQNQNLRRRGN